MQIKKEANFSLADKANFNTDKNRLKKLKDEILGKNYDLSLVFIEENLMKKLHKAHLKKDGATTVLSFPLSAVSGEIFLCPAFIRKESKKYNLDFKIYFKKLYIHGLLHLKGMEHGKNMEKEEEKFLII